MKRIAVAALFVASLMSTASADSPTLPEMDAYAARLDKQDLATLAALANAPVLFVAPDGQAANPGTKEAPLDLATALSDKSPAKAGMVVWLKGGTYRGPFDKAPTPCGSAGKPLVFRAVPGERVTLTAGVESGSVLSVRGDHTWFWGMEVIADPEPPKVRGDAIKVAGGNGLKLINLVIHDTPNRSGIGGWNVGDDQEFYGCLVYRVGLKSAAYAHGTYTQNTAKHTVKRISDCLFFDTYGFGVHCYGQDPALANYRFDGVGAWGNGLPEGSEKPVVNFLVGCYKNQDNLVLRDCFTHFPREGKFKRGADVGYVGKDNGNTLVENCTFVGGVPALHVISWRRPIVRGNRIASSNGLLHVVLPEAADLTAYVWDKNTYYAMGVEKPFSSNVDPLRWRADKTSTLYTPAEWRAAFKVDANSRFLAAPEGVWTIVRVNRYEPERVHLAVYNWTGAARVALDLSAVLKLGQEFRLQKADDLWGEAVLKGKYDGKPLSVILSGAHAPEFAGYILVRKP